MTWVISDSKSIKEVVKNLQKDIIRELATAYPEVKASEILAGTLSTIAETTGRKFIFIIDEWDALLREAKADAKLQK